MVVVFGWLALSVIIIALGWLSESDKLIITGTAMLLMMAAIVHIDL